MSTLHARGEIFKKRPTGGRKLVGCSRGVGVQWENFGIRPGGGAQRVSEKGSKKREIVSVWENGGALGPLRNLEYIKGKGLVTEGIGEKKKRCWRETREEEPRLNGENS